MPALTENQQRFCVEYAASGNGTRAYMSAFPECSYNSARNLAARLLQKVAIKKEIAAARKSFTKDVATDARKVLVELSSLAHSDLSEVFEQGSAGEPVLKKWNSISPTARNAIKKIKVRSRFLKGQGDDGDKVLEIETEVTFHSKDAALDKLCKYFGLVHEGAGYWGFLNRADELQKWVKAYDEAVMNGTEPPPSPFSSVKEVFDLRPPPGGFDTNGVRTPEPGPEPPPPETTPPPPAWPHRFGHTKPDPPPVGDRT